MDFHRIDMRTSSAPLSCGSCESRHRGICGALSAEELIRASRYAVRHSAEAGQEISAESLETKSYSNIISGVVKLSKMMSDGRLQIVGLHFAPDFLGRPLRKDNGVTAEAATVVELCSFPKLAMDRMIGEMPEIERKLHEQSLNELDEARDWMLTLGRKTAAEKVASFLLLIATHADPELEADSCEFDLPLSRGDIADFLGLTIETVSRQMTKLRKDGVILLENNRHLFVPDLERLSDRTST